MATVSFERLTSGNILYTKDGSAVNLPGGDWNIVGNDSSGRIVISDRNSKKEYEILSSDTITKTISGATSSVSGTASQIAQSLAENVFLGNISVSGDSPVSVNSVWVGSQAQYDALVKDANTLYFIQ
jgi:hypothetical protein